MPLCARIIKGKTFKLNTFKGQPQSTGHLFISINKVIFFSNIRFVHLNRLFFNKNQFFRKNVNRKIKNELNVPLR